MPFSTTPMPHGMRRSPPGQYVMLAVSDTGTGMAPEIMSAGVRAVLLDQAGGRRDRPRPVPGLRLRQAVGRAHQALQRARPRHDGEDLPATLARCRGPRGGASCRPRPRRGRDRAAWSRTMPPSGWRQVELLQDLGYRVLPAADAEAALAILSEGIPVDLLFTDVVMPGPITSRELARRARKLLPADRRSVHLGLHRERDHSRRPAGSRHAAAQQALSRRRAGAPCPAGALEREAARAGCRCDASRPQPLSSWWRTTP